MGTFNLYFNYDANGGSGAPGSQTFHFLISTYPHTITKNILSTKPSRTYYTFLGWSQSSSASSASLAAGGSVSTTVPSSSVTSTTFNFYAVWKRNTAYVYYKANGGSGAPSTQSHNAGSYVTLSSTKPTRTGYKFLGWSTSSSATSATYSAGGSYALYTTVTLYAVWELAIDTISASSANLGDTITITVSKYNANYTDNITYSFGDASGTIASSSTATSISWTPPTTLASEIPNASSATCTLTCKTYNGSTLLGTYTKTITLSVPQSLAPTASVSFADTVATPLSWGLYVQSRSKLSFTITASAQESATIASYATTVNGTTYSGASFTTDVLLYSGSNSYSTVVTDSRGLQTTVTGTFTVITYSNPSVTLISCDRDDSNAETVNIEFDFNVASVSSNNDANYAIDYKKKSVNTWTSGATTALGSYSGTITDTLTGIDEGDEYDIRIRVIDSFTTASITTEVGVSGNILLNSRHEGGLGLLMKSQADDQMDVGKPTVFHGSNKEMYGSIVGTHSASGNYAKVLEFGSSAVTGTGKNLLKTSGLVYGTPSDVAYSNATTRTFTEGTYISGITSNNYYRVRTTAHSVSNNSVVFTTEAAGYGLAIPVTGLTVSTAYTVSATMTNGRIGLSFYTEDGTWISGSTASASSTYYTATVPSNAYYTLVLFNSSTASTESTFTDIQLELGSEQTSYEAYVDTSNIAVDAPVTLEYIRTSDENPTKLTINFSKAYALESFVTDNSTDAYLVHSGTALWDLYIGKDNSSDSVEILDMHNPWSNSDMTLTWGSTSVSTLPTGYVQASLGSMPNSQGDLLYTGQREYSFPSGVSVSTSTYTDVASITLDAGVWILIGVGQFSSNSSGRRRVHFSSTSGSSSDLGAIFKDVQSAVSDAETMCAVTAYRTVTSTETFYFVAWQNSGSSLTVTGRLQAVRIA